MRFLWILVIECLREVLCGGSFERLKFKRDTVNNTTKTERHSSPSDDSHDHDHHHTIIWILVGILCAIVVLGLCIGIITGIYCFWKKKKGVNTEEKGSKVPQTFANEQIRNSADRKTDNTPFQSNLGQINASANPKKSVKKTVSSIFGSAPKVEPRAPKTSKKRKIKLISTKGRKKNFYMQNDQQQESSIIEEMINSPGPSGVGSKENVINPPGLPTLGSNENMNPSKASLAPLTRTSSNVPLTSGLASGILPSNNTVLTTTNNGGGGKTFETVENNQNKPSAGDGTSTSYEEAEKKSMEVIEGPCPPAGYRARGPLAPHHIPPEKWKHRGELVIKKRQKVVLKHELQNDPPAEVKSTDHVEFDSKMNEVVDFGPGVEKVISNKSAVTTLSTALPASSKKIQTPKPPTIINREKHQQQQQQQPSSGAADSNKKTQSKKIIGKDEAKSEKTQEFDGNFKF